MRGEQVEQRQYVLFARGPRRLSAHCQRPAASHLCRGEGALQSALEWRRLCRGPQPPQVLQPHTTVIPLRAVAREDAIARLPHVFRLGLRLGV